MACTALPPAGGLPTPAPMIDPFARAITYLRVSVTDRCDFRCVYCMAEDMTFLPKADVLSLEELDRLCSAFVAKGVRKLRLTGGEPLVRRGIMTLVSSLARHIESGALDELTLTTNGSQLRKYARDLVDAGVKRINVSLDTLDPDKFRAITRWGDLHKVLDGDRGRARRRPRGQNQRGCAQGRQRGRVRPARDDGRTASAWTSRSSRSCRSATSARVGSTSTCRCRSVRARLAERFTLDDIDYRTGGPARYVRRGGDRRPARLHHAADA